MLLDSGKTKTEPNKAHGTSTMDLTAERKATGSADEILNCTVKKMPLAGK